MRIAEIPLESAVRSDDIEQSRWKPSIFRLGKAIVDITPSSARTVHTIENHQRVIFSSDPETIAIVYGRSNKVLTFYTLKLDGQRVDESSLTGGVMLWNTGILAMQMGANVLVLNHRGALTYSAIVLNEAMDIYAVNDDFALKGEKCTVITRDSLFVLDNAVNIFVTHQGWLVDEESLTVFVDGTTVDLNTLTENRITSVGPDPIAGLRVRILLRDYYFDGGALIPTYRYSDDPRIDYDNGRFTVHWGSEERLGRTHPYAIGSNTFVFFRDRCFGVFAVTPSAVTIPLSPDVRTLWRTIYQSPFNPRFFVLKDPYHGVASVVRFSDTTGFELVRLLGHNAHVLFSEQRALARVVLEVPGAIQLLDMDSDGRMTLTHQGLGRVVAGNHHAVISGDLLKDSRIPEDVNEHHLALVVIEAGGVVGLRRPMFTLDLETRQTQEVPFKLPNVTKCQSFGTNGFLLSDADNSSPFYVFWKTRIYLVPRFCMITNEGFVASGSHLLNLNDLSVSYNLRSALAEVSTLGNVIITSSGSTSSDYFQLMQLDPPRAFEIYPYVHSDDGSFHFSRKRVTALTPSLVIQHEPNGWGLNFNNDYIRGHAFFALSDTRALGVDLDGRIHDYRSELTNGSLAW